MNTPAPSTTRPERPTPATGPIASAWDDLQDLRIRRYGERVESLDWHGRDGHAYHARYVESRGNVYLRVTRYDADHADLDQDTQWDLPADTPLLQLLAQGIGVTRP